MTTHPIEWDPDCFACTAVYPVKCAAHERDEDEWSKALCDGSVEVIGEGKRADVLVEQAKR